MEDVCKKKGIYKSNASESEVMEMLAFASPIIFGLSSNPRAEQFTWTTHAKSVFKHKKQTN